MKPHNVYPILRIACAMCFIGHGAFGIITKQIWCNYFAVFGIGEHLAYRLMPVVGAADIAFGISLLFYPLRAVAGWLVFWGLFTASLRPLSGEPFAEFIERAGNYGAPFVLLLLTGVSANSWFRKIETADTDMRATDTARRSLQFFAALLMAGHGWLNLIGKKGLLAQYASLGFSHPEKVAWAVGLVEAAGAVLMLVKPLRPMILIFLLWKMTSELFYPRYEFLEWVERGGSYGVLLSLWIITRSKSTAMRTVPHVLSPMTLLLTGVAAFCLTGCTSSTLSEREALRLLNEGNTYPRVVDYSIYCGSTEAAKKATATSLIASGYLTVNLQHAVADVGKPLISFTEKSQPYLMPTSDTAKSIHVQNVKLADETLGEITGITMDENGTHAVVEYTTSFENPSPFVVLLENGFQKNQRRKTFFTRNGKVWQWDKKIIPLAAANGG
jgi:hypothetical protein